MSDLPPPNPGQTGPPPLPQSPPPPSQSQSPPPPPPPESSGGYGYQPANEPPRSSGSNTGKVVVAIMVVAALGVGGIYLAARDDSSSVSTSTSTEATVGTDSPGSTDSPGITVSPVSTDATVPTTEAPAATAAATTIVTTTKAPTTATPTTVAPATTTTATTTAPTSTGTGTASAAIDLGHGVSLPIPSGWSQTSGPGNPVVISDGTTKLGIQALARDPGEDITALVQEYTNTFDSEFSAVGFGPTRFVGPVASPVAINEYRTHYTTFDTGKIGGISGTIDSVVRADGLSVIIDLFSAQPTSVLPHEAYTSLIASLVAAPSQGPAATLSQHAPFAVTSATPFAPVDGLTGFSLAPGFSLVVPGASGFPSASASNGAESFSAIKVTAQTDVNSVIAAAQANLQQNDGNVAYAAPTADVADQFGVMHGAFTWTGTAIDGKPAAGAIGYSLDPATGNAYIAYRRWDTSNGPGEPAADEGAFMQRSFSNTFTTIP